MSKKGMLWVAVVIVLLVLGFMYWGGKEAVEPGSQDDTSALRVGDNAIVVTEQRPGSTANISLAVLGGDGYVVVHEMMNGELGASIGASALLPKGESESVVVSLSKSLEVGKKYSAMLHLDDGDKVFDLAKDAPAMLYGKPVMMEFGVSADAEVDVEVSI